LQKTASVTYTSHWSLCTS